MTDENNELERDEQGRLKTPQSKEGKTAKRVINVIHELVTKGHDSENDSEKGKSKEELAEELTKTKEKLGERETQLGVISMKAFEEEKALTEKKFKKTFNKDAPEISTPSELEFVKGMLEEESEEDEEDEFKGTIYSGKGQPLNLTGGQAKAPSRGLQTGFERGSQVIDTLYNAIDEERYNRKYNKEKFDSKRLQEAERKVAKIWKSLRKGFVKRNYQLMPQGSHRAIWSCPKCGTTNLDTMKCSNPQCDFKVPETESEWHRIR